ncbi:MAG: nickel pincer cofactor biosynthesis protein LarC [Planctomycetes bacterium]|nr:nickel pincer cofactor biosynthesis protein LarC [Planctomycetota bacterium]
MIHAHFDLFSGISGDMTLGALVDAGLPLRDLKRVLAAFPLRGYALRARRVMKGPVCATKVDVVVAKRPHGHTPLRKILALLRRSRIPAPARETAERVFLALGRAEGKVHRTDPMAVEFHEVGAVDSIVDIVGSCAGFHLLGVGSATCTPVPVTHGTIRGDHGPIPLPGPATMEMLRGFPVVALDLDRELVTPTGAALLSTLARPGPFPPMRLTAVGTGAGGWDLPRPNVMRILLGETAAPAESDLVYEIRANLDNAPGDLIGYACEKLFEAGALDVWTEPIQMKKSRPGVALAALVAPDRREAAERILLTETPTFGVRRVLMERSKLDRRTATVRTPYGPIRIKTGCLDGRPVRSAPEYEDVRAAAMRHGVPLSRVLRAALDASRSSHGADFGV